MDSDTYIPTSYTAFEMLCNFKFLKLNGVLKIKKVPVCLLYSGFCLKWGIAFGQNRSINLDTSY
jgi:hypothetical protein